MRLCDPKVLPAQLGSQVVAPGCYSAAASAFALTGILTLKGAGSYIFVTPAAITTAASSIVRLSNGAQCSQVKWCVGAAATLGAQSTFSGSITSQAAITLGAGAIVHGSVKSAIGVITYGAESKAVACAAAALALHASLSAVAGCPVGNAGPRCSPCPVGSYSLAGATRCTHCPPGFSCPIASVGPDACYPLPASIHAMLAAVGGCPVGNAGPACSPCPIGSYSLAGATQCTSCAYGFHARLPALAPMHATPSRLRLPSLPSPSFPLLVAAPSATPALAALLARSELFAGRRHPLHAMPERLLLPDCKCRP